MTAPHVTEADLAEAERLDSEATPGPWTTDEEQIIWHTRGQPGATMRDTIGDTDAEADAAFIARMRTLGPALVREVRRLTEDRNRWQTLADALVARKEALREKARAVWDAEDGACGSAVDALRAEVNKT